MTALRHFDVLKAPHITEKSTLLSEQNKVVFKVAADATKPEIKNAVEKLFGVKVLSVNTVNIGGKNKTFRGRAGRRNDVRKAIVTLDKGQTIEISSGV